jgi:hypothetical protein
MDDSRRALGEHMEALGRLLCRIGVHRWTARNNPEDGSVYLACERCGKEKDTISLSDHYGG